MPDPFNKAKMTGDFHPPEVESDLPLEEASADSPGVSGTPTDRGQAAESGRIDKPTRAVKKAGPLRDDDRGASPGERPRSGSRAEDERG